LFFCVHSRKRLRRPVLNWHSQTF